MVAKLTGDFKDLMQTSDCLTYNPVGDPTDELVVAQPCPDTIGICKRRIGKNFFSSITVFCLKNMKKITTVHPEVFRLN